METLWQDLRYGARQLARSPGFTAVAVLTLALGIGANTVIFSLVDAVLLQPLPYPAGERLVIAARKQPGTLRTVASYPDFSDWQESGVLEKSAAVVGRAMFLETPEGLQWLVGGRVSEEFFDVLGVHPALGRGFLPEEVRRGEDVAVISHKLWVARFGADPEILGKDMPMRGQTFRVIGVLPPGFEDPIRTPAKRDLYVPLEVSPEERVARQSHWLTVVGRLRDGITLEQAAGVIEGMSARAQKELEGRDPRSLAPFTLVRLRDHQVGNAKAALWLLLGAVGFVLLIGCANVSNLLLARLTSRQHELAIRAAVGASPRRVAGQLLTEGLLLSALSGVAALAFAAWSLDVVKAVSPVTLPRLAGAGLDLRVFAFALAVTVVSGLVLGLLPVLRGARQDVFAALKQSSGSGGVTHTRPLAALVVAEVALTVVLLVGAGLAVNSFQRLLQVDPGFQTRSVLTVSLVYAGEWEQAQQSAFFDELTARVRALPGVRAAGVVDNLPYSGAWSQFTTTIEGFAPDAQPELLGRTVEYQQAVVGGDYFRVMGVPLRAGRFFDERDAAPGAASVIVSESLARNLWGDRDPLGRKVSDGETRNAQVVGVVGDVRHFGPDSPLAQTLYRPLAQRAAWRGTLVVTAERDSSLLLPAIRDIARSIDRAVVLQPAETMDELLWSRTASQRFLALLLGSFGGLALLLASLGVYGVLAYSVSRRTREIGVRIALGASPGEVLRMVVRQGIAPAGIGMAIGLVAALGLSRFLRGQLYEVSPTDPWTYGVAAIVLAAVALLACWVPARRAARVDPMVALRYE